MKEQEGEDFRITGLLNSVRSLFGLSKKENTLNKERVKEDEALNNKREIKRIDNSVDSLNRNAIVPKNSMTTSEAINASSPVSFSLNHRFELYPENRRRPVNKKVYENCFFHLIYNTKNNALTIENKGDLIYSAIPYDTARNYIQKAAIQSLLHPDGTRKYIERHRSNLEKYLALSLSQISSKRVSTASKAVHDAYQMIFQNPLFQIQILGRLMQHDETGPISANLPGKFLFSENVNTGISAYVAEYLKFVVELTQQLPITTDGRNVHLIEGESADIEDYLNRDSDISAGAELMPSSLKNELIAFQAISSPQDMINRPLLRSDVGKQVSAVRKNYVAHSQHPQKLEKYFDNVLSTENKNKINVVSDIHTLSGKLPFTNRNFNILVGDVSDSNSSDKDIRGLYLIGNHELSDILSNAEILMKKEWDTFREYEWFKDLIIDPDQSWPKLPLGDHYFYQIIQAEISSRYPKMIILNNETAIYKGVRYIGLTIPVALVARKMQLQAFIFNQLKRLLGGDTTTPTVIVSHAPLFNELSMLSPNSRSYRKEYHCENDGILNLFNDFNIIGAIHGHHHIPASSGRSKIVNFAGKKLFVVCSIYSNINTGFELADLLPDESSNQWVRKVIKNGGGTKDV
ncbi:MULTISPECIES: metallophosphoesterase [unclassified Enterococcus]|uniref:metallophosphoesterase n=1 Tax=unclassified Enterococcus TaxID=2608891 RepID=UPI001555D685|nr:MULTISPECIES: metallophosphoesterase [unclassified Enterococcus]MBS7577592.1 metallophosphoesterase [Enterococcus sp. MMGLQ5-2]MBS7584909.1 metallophosphoesterase [Enterococcus sp. MMGLQ5-1]NPD12764.1 metallophosphoesterase [Enterococcus sp. MMGLQ5-1]NPD37425.1 metallophosphoesterase [Enterococcus sp. MMGLQ5-2]